jgi:DNA-binding SARP family transcriptional activator
LLKTGLFGSFNASFDGQPISSLNTPRLQSVLAYLIWRCDTPQPCQHVTAVFWPDADRYLQADASTLRWCAN